MIICIPDIFNGLQKYTKTSKLFWTINLRKRNSLYNQLKDVREVYGNAFISRPYIDMKKKDNSAIYFKQLKQLWDDRSILIVEGEKTCSGVGNDLFDNAKQIQRIICPSRNAFTKVKEIELSVLKYKGSSLILLMLGPTAKIIVDDLQDIDNQLIDIGHIDSEYEWFIRKTLKKVKIPYKHTAEFNYDDDISLIHDDNYSNEIVCKIK